MPFINLADQLFNKNNIPEGAQVVFVSDMFASDYPGGAELTTEALLEACPLEVFRVRSKDVSMELLEKGFQKFWVFGNFANLDKNLIPTICANLRYSIVEYDYKFCRYRSPEKHAEAEKCPCNCNNEENGLLVSTFMHAAASLWWMSERQMERYHRMFPFLASKPNTVLSSVFDDKTFAVIKRLSEKVKDQPRTGWVVMGSPSWIKGTDEAKLWCETNNLPYEVVWDLPYEVVLEKLSKAEGLVFLPKGGDTCPRMVIEAKLLGCQLHLNDNVEHKDEIWFDTQDPFDTEAYLYLSRDRFWNGIKADMAFNPSISGYTTTKDCIQQDYPFKECITSMLGFCDEVVVVDGGSTDGTWEQLQEMALVDKRVILHQQKRDWHNPRFAVFDGAQKALARSMCKGDFCWQMDADEVVHETDYQKVKDLVKQFPKGVNVLALPVVEYWGGQDKVRMDINVWKWRLSRNAPEITHGIPKPLRKYDAQGNLFSAPGSDGCDYIRSDTFDPVQFITFYTADVEMMRRATLSGNAQAQQQLNAWFNETIDNLPGVFHFSWFNIGRKVKTYKEYWSKHWESLYDVKQDDIAENNKFFDKPWSDVSDEEMGSLAGRLRDEMGGWIFHNRIDFSKKTPHMTCNKKMPSIMAGWAKRNS